MGNNLNLDVGCCIYCGHKDGNLSREHVMPRGLGGNWAPDGMANALVLRNASCESCRKITEDIERKCLIGMMDPAREKLGLKRKDRLNAKTLANLELVNGEKEDRYVTWDSVPGPMILPSFYTAGFFAGRKFYNHLPCDHKIIITHPASAFLEKNVKGVGVSIISNPKLFAQMLSKIALGLAVAYYGLEKIKPLVRDIILKDGTGYGYYVGGYAEKKREEPKMESLHKATFGIVKKPGQSGDFLIVDIRLFAEYDSPTNYVVVGRFK